MCNDDERRGREDGTVGSGWDGEVRPDAVGVSPGVWVWVGGL